MTHLIAIIDTAAMTRVLHRTAGIPRVGEYIQALDDKCCYRVDRVIWPLNVRNEVQVALECTLMDRPKPRSNET